MNIVPSGFSWGFSALDIFNNAQSIIKSVAELIVLLIAFYYGNDIYRFLRWRVFYIRPLEVWRDRRYMEKQGYTYKNGSYYRKDGSKLKF